MKGKAINATMQYSFSIQKPSTLLLTIAVIASVNPRGEHFHVLRSEGGGGGGLDLASSLEAKFGAKKPKKMEKFKIQSQNLGYLSPIFEIIWPNGRKSLEFKGQSLAVHRGNFWIIVTHISGGKVWGSDKSCRGKIWGQGPPTSNCGSAPLGS